MFEVSLNNIESLTERLCASLQNLLSGFDSHRTLNMQKRYQYWSKDGIVWTDWFNWEGEKLPSPFKKLKVEYREDPTENTR